MKTLKRFGAHLWPHKKLSPKHTKALMSPQRGKISDYGTQLLAYQRFRAVYGWPSKNTMVRTLEKARRYEGRLSDTFVILFERRLDTQVYRSLWARSMDQARYLVHYGHIQVNGRTASSPGYYLEPGDVVSLSSEARSFVQAELAHTFDTTSQVQHPHMHDHLEVDYMNGCFVYLYAPQIVDHPSLLSMDHVLQALET
jgi:ribosomal protein S4